MAKRKAPMRRGGGHCKGKGKSCGCGKGRKSMKGMKGKGWFSKIRKGIKKVTSNPIVKTVRKVADAALTSPLMPEPISLAYESADRTFRVANELSKGNVKGALKEGISTGPVSSYVADKVLGSGRKNSRARHPARAASKRVAAAGSRVHDSVMTRRR